MRPVRIAVIGAGLIGRRHADAIERTEGAALACVVDPAPEARVFAEERDAPWRDGVEAMLDDALADGAIVATPNQMHVAHARGCVGAGLPVLIEKPIADVAADAAGLVDEAEAACVPLLVGHHRRHNPLVAAAKAKLESGAVGDVVAVHAFCWLYKPDDYFTAEWRRRAGAGPVFINLIHDIDLLRWLVGEIAAVQAFEASAARGHEVEDTAAVVLRFANGALGTVTVSDSIVAPWSWELTAAENPAYPATGQTCCMIGGTRGSLEIPTGGLWSQRGERSWWRPIDRQVGETPRRDPLDAQIAHFRDVILGRAAPLVSGREGLRSLRVIEAIKRAARDGGVVDVA